MSVDGNLDHEKLTAEALDAATAAVQQKTGVSEAVAVSLVMNAVLHYTPAFLRGLADAMVQDYPDPNPLASIFEPYVVHRIAKHFHTMAAEFDTTRAALEDVAKEDDKNAT